MKKYAGFDTVAGLLLICVFTAAIFLSLACGAGIYKDVSRVLEQQYEARTAIGYITTRVHDADAGGGVGLGDLDGTPALVLTQEQYGISFATYIYYHNGYLMELYGLAAETFTPADGLKIVAARGLELRLEGSLLQVICQTDAGTAQTLVALSSRKGGGL